MKSLIGLIYHELGHICFTDFSKLDMSSDLVTFNILEDIYIENVAMATVFPFTKPYFKDLQEKAFVPEKYEYADEEWREFLLMKLRNPRVSFKCNVYDTNKDEIDSMIFSFLRERDTKIRVGIANELSIFMNSLTRYDRRSIDRVAKALPGKSKTIPGAPSIDTPHEVASELDGIASDEAAESIVSGSMDEECSGGSEIYRTHKYSTSKEAFEYDEKTGEKRNSRTGFYGNSVAGHRFVKIEQDIRDASLLDEKYINDVIQKNRNIVKATEGYLKTFKLRLLDKEKGEQLRGDINTKYLIKYDSKGILPPPKMFKSKNESALKQDFAVALLCDNSGSMCGTKAKITCDAVSLLAAACDNLKIPFECCLFTASMDGVISADDYTVRLKSFTAPFGKTKKYFAAIKDDSSYLSKSRVRYFGGNRDEVQLYCNYERLKKEKYKKILFIVLSDGNPTGDRRDLKIITQKIEKDQKFFLQGIGICDHSVTQYYSNNIVLEECKDVEKLPKMVLDIITREMKKNKK